VLQALRVAIGVVAGALLLVGVGLLAAGGVLVWPGVQLVLVGAAGLVIAFFERLRYRSQGTSGGGELRPTEERFIDPTTGERTRVWIDSASGERSYHPDGESKEKP